MCAVFFIYQHFAAKSWETNEYMKQQKLERGAPVRRANNLQIKTFSLVIACWNPDLCFPAVVKPQLSN